MVTVSCHVRLGLAAISKVNGHKPDFSLYKFLYLGLDLFARILIFETLADLIESIKPAAVLGTAH